MKFKKLIESTNGDRVTRGKNRNRLTEMTIGYDQKSIENQIKVLKNNIADYEQLLIDEPDDADYWKEMIAKCQADIEELNSYAPLK